MSESDGASNTAADSTSSETNAGDTQSGATMGVETDDDGSTTEAESDSGDATTASEPGAFDDDFEGSGPLVDYVTDNAEALPDVARLDGRYRAHVVDNGQNQTMHFNEARGRIDAKLVAFPFDLVARNVGIGLPDDSQSMPAAGQDAVLFAGLEVHDTALEAKNTVAHVSQLSDTGDGTVPDARADIRLVGDANGHLTAYWQLPGTSPDNWTPYRGDGELPGPQADFGDEVYVGLITYAGWSNGLPFVGTCDGLESN
jgi:hypothetical protein